MSHVSVGLSQELHVDKLIDLVKVSIEGNVQISLAHTNRRQHKITNEMFAMKWGISDSK